LDQNGYQLQQKLPFSHQPRAENVRKDLIGPIYSEIQAFNCSLESAK